MGIKDEAVVERGNLVEIGSDANAILFSKPQEYKYLLRNRFR